jgi:hypothetical protein
MYNEVSMTCLRYSNYIDPLKQIGECMSHLLKQLVNVHFIFMGFVWFSL